MNLLTDFKAVIHFGKINWLLQLMIKYNNLIFFTQILSIKLIKIFRFSKNKKYFKAMPKIYGGFDFIFCILSKDILLQNISWLKKKSHHYIRIVGIWLESNSKNTFIKNKTYFARDNEKHHQLILIRLKVRINKNNCICGSPKRRLKCFFIFGFILKLVEMFQMFIILTIAGVQLIYMELG